MPLVIFTVLTALLVLVTLLPLTRSPVWWIQAMIFPRLQITLVGLALLAGELLWLDLSSLPARALVLITLGCVLYQAWWILPYTPLYRKEVRSHRERKSTTQSGAVAASRIRIISANVLGTNRNVSALIKVIRDVDPDLFVTLESDAWWEKQLQPLERDYPYTIKCPLDNLYGMHVFSRLPLEDTSTKFLVQEKIPSMHASVLLPGGHRAHVHFLHPAPPSPTQNEVSVPRDAELLVVGRSVVERDAPIIVAGDLNDVAWSATTRLFRKISGLLDPRIGRGMFNTFHAGHWWVRWPLDHLFHSKHFTLSFMRRLPAIGSDHFPVAVELVYDEQRGAQQDGLEADAEDRARARRKIDKRDVEVSDVPKPGMRASLRPSTRGNGMGSDGILP